MHASDTHKQVFLNQNLTLDYIVWGLIKCHIMLHMSDAKSVFYNELAFINIYNITDVLAGSALSSVICHRYTRATL